MKKTPTRTEPSRRKSSETSWPLVGLGVCIVAFGGVIVPSDHSYAACATIFVGAFLVVLGLFYGSYRERLPEGIEVGRNGIQISWGSSPDPTPWVQGTSEDLNKLAALTLGDADRAAEVVEETLSAVDSSPQPISEQERDVVIYQTFVRFLEREDERAWREGRSKRSPESIAEAVPDVPFRSRIAYVLRQHGLQPNEVADILERSAAEVEIESQAARAELEIFSDGMERSADD